jgi:hypothetical protein
MYLILTCLAFEYVLRSYGPWNILPRVFHLKSPTVIYVTCGEFFQVLVYDKYYVSSQVPAQIHLTYKKVLPSCDPGIPYIRMSLTRRHITCSGQKPGAPVSLYLWIKPGCHACAWSCWAIYAAAWIWWHFFSRTPLKPSTPPPPHRFPFHIVSEWERCLLTGETDIFLIRELQWEGAGRLCNLNFNFF